jgi:hypothetical protein
MRNQEKLMSLILCDAQIRPDLFFWNGAIDSTRLRAWLSERNLSIPNDLFDFLLLTGGGNVFETEDLLCPFGSKELGEDFDSVNSFHRSRGLPDNLLIFHIGLGISAIQMAEGLYVSCRESDYSVEHTFQTMEDWYRCTIRREYYGRYGLPPVQTA